MTNACKIIEEVLESQVVAENVNPDVLLRAVSEFKSTVDKAVLDPLYTRRPAAIQLLETLSSQLENLQGLIKGIERRV